MYKHIFNKMDIQTNRNKVLFSYQDDSSVMFLQLCHSDVAANCHITHEGTSFILTCLGECVDYILKISTNM